MQKGHQYNNKVIVNFLHLEKIKNKKFLFDSESRDSTYSYIDLS